MNWSFSKNASRAAVDGAESQSACCVHSASYLPLAGYDTRRIRIDLGPETRSVTGKAKRHSRITAPRVAASTLRPRTEREDDAARQDLSLGSSRRSKRNRRSSRLRAASTARPLARTARARAARARRARARAPRPSRGCATTTITTNDNDERRGGGEAPEHRSRV